MYNRLMEKKAYLSSLDAGEIHSDRFGRASPTVKSMRMTEAEFNKISGLSCQIISGSARELEGLQIPAGDSLALIDALKKTNRVSMTKKFDEFVELESLVLDMLRDRGALNGVKGIEFPFNLRVTHPSPPPEYLSLPDATHLLHCDPWAGVPGDTVNFFFYIEVDNSASQIEFLDISEENLAAFEKHTGTYREAASLLEGLNPLKVEAEPGLGYVFDSYHVHRTRCGADSIRISIDFRVRLEDPYAVLDETWFLSRVYWHRYWYLPEGTVKNFRERCFLELEKLNALGLDEAVKFREKAIEIMK